MFLPFAAFPTDKFTYKLPLLYFTKRVSIATSNIKMAFAAISNIGDANPKSAYYPLGIFSVSSAGFYFWLMFLFDLEML